MEFKVNPIGHFRCAKTSPAEAARQACLDTSEAWGRVVLNPGCNFEQALQELSLFSHLWLIYQFHRNSHWKPMVLPPRGSEKKVGVFATRSPYRPNPIGMSAVKLEKIEGLVLHVSGFDLLDETPILDLKPYLAYSDAIPEASQGWIKSQDSLEVEFSEVAAQQLQKLSPQLPEFKSFISNQLGSRPLKSPSKRIKFLNSEEGVLAYKTWRVNFRLQDDRVRVLEVAHPPLNQ